MLGSILWVILGVVILGYYNALLLLDDRTPNSDPNNLKIKNNWHAVGASLFLYLAGTAWYMFGWKYAPFSLSCFWTLYAGIVNEIALKKSFFFVGTTAKTDRIIRWISPKRTEEASAIMKISALLGSILLIFLM